MKLNEIKTISTPDLTPKQTEMDPQDMAAQIIPTNQTQLGSGIMADAYADEETHPGTVTKVIRYPMGLDSDAYFKYVMELAKNDRISGNPYFPKIYNVTVLSDYNKQSMYKVEMERLQSFTTLSSEEIMMLGEKIFDNFRSWVRAYTQERSKINKQFNPSSKDLNHKNKGEIQQAFVDRIQKVLRGASPYGYGDSKDFASIKDPYLKKALMIIRSLVRGSHGAADIHAGNVMIRRGPGGPQLVITDPLV